MFRLYGCFDSSVEGRKIRLLRQYKKLKYAYNLSLPKEKWKDWLASRGGPGFVLTKKQVSKIRRGLIDFVMDGDGFHEIKIV